MPTPPFKIIHEWVALLVGSMWGQRKSVPIAIKTVIFKSIFLVHQFQITTVSGLDFLTSSNLSKEGPLSVAIIALESSKYKAKIIGWLEKFLLCKEGATEVIMMRGQE